MIIYLTGKIAHWIGGYKYPGDLREVHAIHMSMILEIIIILFCILGWYLK